LKKKISDTDYLHITTRIRSLERQLLNNSRTERMLEARTDDEAAKVLSECGYGEVSMASANDLERVLAESRGGLFAAFESIAPDRALINVFRAKYDYHNLKAIIKSEALSGDAEDLLIDSGRVKAKALLDMLRQDDLRNMPTAMKNAALEARDVLLRTSDPQLSDVLLDNACFKEMREMAAKSKSRFLLGYVKLYIDAANLRAVVRALRVGRGADFLRGVLSPGGYYDPARVIAATVAGSQFSEFYVASLLEEAAAVGAPTARGEMPLTTIERLCDIALIRYMKSAKIIAFGEQPFIAYIAAKEAEIVSIRTIMSGCKAGVSTEVIRERLRESYV